MVEIIKEEMEKGGREVKVTSIEQGYDVDAEVANHIWADIIIMQSPVYWFGMPWPNKKYVDEVFTAGMTQGTFLAGDGRTRQDPSKQYGSGGSMHGKKYMMSLTWNAPRDAFGDKDQPLFEGRTVDDVLIGNTAYYKFRGVDVVTSFSCHDVMKVPDIENDISGLREHLAKLDNIGDYDTVIFGYPDWWGTIPMALFTFLEEYDLSGKTIIPFCTHEGSGLGRGEQDIAKLEPKATLCDGLAVRGGGVGRVRNDVNKWLTKLGYR